MVTLTTISRVGQNPMFRLVYFNSRGTAELTRYLLAFTETAYDDIRYPISPAEKGFSPDAVFWKHKNEGHFDATMGKLPLLQVLTPDGEAALANLGQTRTIDRFIAQRRSCFGGNDIEKAQIDAFYENIRDIRHDYLKAKQRGERQKWMEKELLDWCQKLEKALPKISALTTSSPWLIGKDASLADIALYSLLGTATSPTMGSVVSGLDDFNPKGVYETDCPRLKDSIQALSEDQNIQWWERTRPDTFS